MLVILVPHTHWDREWYETAARLRQRLVEAVDRLLDILEGDPDFSCFLLDGQVVLVDDYLAVRPERRDRLAALVREGRLLVGPWYILADELLSSGEALVRNLLVGRTRAAAVGGAVSLGYSPDAFGHPAMLPAILQGFSIGTAILWRGYGGEAGQEQDLFRWTAPDGATVLVHHLPPPGYEIGAGLPAGTGDLAARWKEIEEMLVPRAAGGVLLLPAGADHHAPDPALPSRVAALGRLAPGHEFRIASPTEYFAALPQQLTLPTVTGELRFSYRYAWTLQGTSSTRAGLKRAVREGDTLLVRWADPQVALAHGTGSPDRQATLGMAWREHLLNHFHDSLCGTVSDEVAAEVSQRARSVARQARGLLVDALHDRLGQDRARARREPRWAPALVVVNPSARPVRQVVEATVTVHQRDVVVGRPAAPGASPGPAELPGLVDADGREVPVQLLGEADAYERLDSPDHYPDLDRVRAFRVALDPGVLPPVGLRSLAAGRTGRKPADPLASVDPSDPRFATDRWPRVESARDEGDAYTFEPVEGDQPVEAQWTPPTVLWRGPLVVALSREFTVGDRARGIVSARVDAGSLLTRFAIDGTNQRGQHRLRVRIPPLPAPGHRAPQVCSAVADMQLGPVTRRREDHPVGQFPREWPVPTAPVHRYVSVATGRGTGFTVFIRGASEYELTPEGAVAVTVLRAVGDLSRGDLRARPGHAAWPQPTPAAEELGPFRVELAVAPVAVTEESSAEEWGRVEALAEEFHAAPAGLMLRYGIMVPAAVEGPELRGAGLAFSALKLREDGPGVVARCVNLSREPVEGAWHWHVPIARAWRARLDETPLSELTPSGEGRELRFTAAPREVVTVIVEADGRSGGQADRA